MSLDDFIKKYEGKGIDFDSAFQTQCVDLYRQYTKDVLGFPQSPGVVGAKDIWDTYLPDYFERVENTPHGVPERGDIVIWGTKLGKFGHVAIFLSGDANRFTSLDQNFPEGSLVHKQEHTYTGILGWLRPIKEEMQITDQTRIESILSEDGHPMEVQAIRSELEDRREKAISNEKTIKEQSESLRIANENLSTKTSELAKALQNLEKEREDSAKWEKKYRTADQERADEAYEHKQTKASLERSEKTVKELRADTEKLETRKRELLDKITQLTQSKLENISLWMFIKTKYLRGGE